MLTDKVLLKTISDMKGITGAEISVWNLDGSYLIGTDEVREIQQEWIQAFIETEMETLETSFVSADYQVHMIYMEEEPQYLVLFEQISEEAEIPVALCVNQLENLSLAYQEPLNKQMVLQRLLKGSFEDGELLQQAEKVRIANKARRVVFVIEPKKEEDAILTHTLKNLYATGITDFVVEMGGPHIVFIKELNTTETERDIKQIAYTIADTLSAETMIYVRVAIGNTVEQLQEVENSYREAVMALEVGRSFYADKTVLEYRTLGIGRLIHQLSIPLCEEFLQEVLCGKGLTQFDEETMLSVYKFFDNNLNISETARQLYVHRNTLTYRFEKIQKAIGLDVRSLEDAMTFKMAIMVSNHIQFKKYLQS